MATKKKVKNTPDNRDKAELERAIKALHAVRPNPIAWGPIIAFVGPIIGRIAARMAARYVANKLRRKLSKGMPAETADYVADRVGDVIAKIRLPQQKKE